MSENRKKKTRVVGNSTGVGRSTKCGCSNTPDVNAIVNLFCRDIHFAGEIMSTTTENVDLKPIGSQVFGEVG